jgi:hypothetical protein
VSSDGCARGRWSERSGHLVTTMTTTKVQQKKRPSNPAAKRAPEAPRPGLSVQEQIDALSPGARALVLAELARVSMPLPLYGSADYQRSATNSYYRSTNGADLTKAEALGRLRSIVGGDGHNALVQARESFDDVWTSAELMVEEDVDRIDEIRRFAARFTDFARLLKTYLDDGAFYVQVLYGETPPLGLHGDGAVRGRPAPSASNGGGA